MKHFLLIVYLVVLQKYPINNLSKLIYINTKQVCINLFIWEKLVVNIHPERKAHRRDRVHQLELLLASLELMRDTTKLGPGDRFRVGGHIVDYRSDVGEERFFDSVSMLQTGDLFAVRVVVEVLDELVLEHERGGGDILKFGRFIAVEVSEDVALGKAWVRHLFEGLGDV